MRNTGSHRQSKCLTLDEMHSRLISDFRSRFSREPKFIAIAPGRVNLIGEHIDYNDGFVLPMAIERYVIFAASARDRGGRIAKVHSLDLQETVELPIGGSAIPSVDGWGRYLEGIIAGFAARGVQVPPFDAVVASNVPIGGGLSSSAALEVAMATLIEGLTETTLQPIEKAFLCQKSEHEFIGVPCGIMDQSSSVFASAGHLMLIDCQSNELELIPFNDAETSVLIVNSNIKHELSGGEYAARRADCERALAKIGKASWRDVNSNDVDEKGSELTEVEFRRSRHVFSEIDRTMHAAKAIRAGNLDSVGELMYASHYSLRDDFEVSCPELDLLVEIAHDIGTENGVIGSRMTGGGFGGCTVTLVAIEKIPAVVEILTSRYESATGLKASWFSSRPAQGARLLTIGQ